MKKPVLMPGDTLAEAEEKRLFQQSIDESVHREKQSTQHAKLMPGSVCPKTQHGNSRSDFSQVFLVQILLGNENAGQITLLSGPFPELVSVETKVFLFRRKNPGLGVAATRHRHSSPTVKGFPLI